jgi:type IV pilus biogenesis protein CpaD/CtpE
MKTLLAILLLAAAAVPAAAGPDFVASTVDPRPLAASHSERAILPSDDIVFEHDSAALIDSAQQQLVTVARYMKSHDNVRLVVEGHTNNLGAAAYNEDLATRRADLVRNHLVALGVPSDRIMMVVYGEAQAERVASPIDRRVVMFATRDSTDRILAKSLRRGQALMAAWTRRGVLFTEHHRLGSPTRVAAR